ncbi:SPL family radical SAM protein [Haloferula sp.]|uniref:SPL family radical SAM protein n=1 Tax=Haloferula sp. TaxID=2497595 RepID=UPI003C71B8F6
MISALYDSPATIERNRFKYKSLSSWALNLFMGCAHGCRFCYVTETSIKYQQGLLESYGVTDPVADWGNYVLVRPWDRKKFMTSLRKAERTPVSQLNADGNRAVFLCSTTDPYQTIRNPDAAKQKLLNELARQTLRNALEAIRDYSTLNVRILTRSPLARQDFDIFKSFGNRLLLGTSLPTLDETLRKLYEPSVPHPNQRLKLLLDAHKAGIPTYVAVAPVFPEVGYKGMLDVFKAVKAAKPHTIFMEPVNLRLGIAERIARNAEKLGVTMDMSIYDGGPKWVEYAIQSLKDAEKAAKATRQLDRLHLWPDHEALGSKKAIRTQPDPEAYAAWLQSYWDRVSEWPGKK